MAKKRYSFFKKTIISILLIILISGVLGGYWVYKAIYQSNVSLGDKKSQIIYIHTGSDFNDVMNMLYEKNIIVHRTSFEWLAEKKNYKNNIKPGKYRILARMSNNELINLLRAGLQEPVRITFTNIRTKAQLVSRVCLKIEADSIVMGRLLNDNTFLKKYGMNSDNVLILFIPHSYEFYWNTSPEQFLERMAQEYKKIWTEERKLKARNMRFTQTEISILASIVQAEQSRFDEEKPAIAGLYINRLKKGMPLQSDPTLVYANGNFSVTRVLNQDKEIDSPYNTYKYIGLPPGPICLPEVSSLDAVLNYEKHDYLYMCAKDDLSCKHNFAKTLDQHNVYASKYRNALNKRNIKR